MIAVSYRLLAVSLVIVTVGPVGAQQAPTDSLRLGALHQRAVAADPRQGEFTLLARQTELRLRNISAERLPTISAQAQAQYQSDVFTPPRTSGGSTVFPSPSNDTYDSRISVEQTIVDAGIGMRQRVERARQAESEAMVRSALFDLRREVNDAFFSAALLTERRRLLAATVTDLETQLQEAGVRVREGAALPSDTAALLATLLARRQDGAEVDAQRRAALIRLTALVQQPVSGTEAFALPDLNRATSAARAGLDALRQRPEYAQFASTRNLLTRQQEAVSADQKPRLSAFGQAGYGRPGLNPVSDNFDSYALAGMRVTWSPWNWGKSGRERQAIAILQDIVAAEEAAFASRLTRDIQSDLADIERLDTAITLDDQIVALREQVDAETGIRFREGVVTASEYVDRTTDVLEARLTRATHRVEQVQARARFLTSLGVEIQ